MDPYSSILKVICGILIIQKIQSFNLDSLKIKPLLIESKYNQLYDKNF